MTSTKIKYLIGLLILCSTLLWYCQKKTFKRVTVTGRLFHLATQQPFSDSEVALYGDDATSSKSQTQNTIKLTSSTTNGDGSFTLKTKASKRGNYYLWLKKGDGLATVYINGQRGFSVADNSTKDVGDIYVDW